MSFPEVTHLQAFLLAELMEGERTGRHLRERLAAVGHTKSGPAFYQLLARMEDAKFVKGRYDQKMVEGQVIKERVYEITGTGVRAVEDVRNFYLARPAGLGFQGV